MFEGFLSNHNGFDILSIMNPHIKDIVSLNGWIPESLATFPKI